MKVDLLKWFFTFYGILPNLVLMQLKESAWLGCLCIFLILKWGFCWISDSARNFSNIFWMLQTELVKQAATTCQLQHYMTTEQHDNSSDVTSSEHHHLTSSWTTIWKWVLQPGQCCRFIYVVAWLRLLVAGYVCCLLTICNQLMLICILWSSNQDNIFSEFDEEQNHMRLGTHSNEFITSTFSLCFTMMTDDDEII